MSDPRAQALRECLDAWTPGTSALVLDLDGTMHRGRWKWARGLSNIDLAFEIGWLLRPLGLPVPPPGHSRRVASFARRERSLRRRLGDHRDYYAEAIEGFRRELLAPLPEGLAERAAGRLTRLAHPDLAEGLRIIGPRFERVLILTKAFQPVADAYGKLLEGILGRPVEAMGNPASGDDPVRFLLGEDKARALGEWLERSAPEAESCLVAGDTRQDLAMGALAAERLGPERAALAALAPKSEDFARDADAAFASWSELARALGTA